MFSSFEELSQKENKLLKLEQFKPGIFQFYVYRLHDIFVIQLIWDKILII